MFALKIRSFYGFPISRKSEAQDARTDGRTDERTDRWTDGRDATLNVVS